MANKDSREKTKIVTTKEFSEILGVTTRRIQQLADAGALIRVGRGQFDCPGSIKRYMEYQIDKVTPDEELDNSVETALWTKARREKTELEVKIIKGELHRSEDVKRVMNDMLMAFRQRTLSLPTKMAPQLIMLEDLAVIKDILKLSVIELLNELKDYDPTVFYEISKDKMFLDDEEDEVSDLHDEKRRL
ncbi:hypothetical protein [Cytobacillus firmus]|uniref:hypothetical protein n=1 Tax=Cytobacillus firmus TaxID=1399 RepID=UPI0018CEC851|nr:hypothetical protein [Cytobacillus firmus]MBG9548398.1 hypothetical protein [Cytobacillus firmus]MBG9604510.1 hypothetical protein [Cytobacillus firmus]MED1942125.1 hypothetical protein [Cytobacillus firmus]